MQKVKDKERILKAAREKKLVTYRGVPMRLSADFSKETLQAGRNSQDIFKVMTSRDLQPRLVYPSKDIILHGSVDKELLRQEKTKGVHHHRTIII